MTLVFRRVKPEDIWMLYAWRKEDQTAFWSLSQPPSIEDHRVWMEKAPFDEGLYIAERKGKPIAVLGVNTENEVSITVNPYLRRQGIGHDCIKFLQRQYPKLKAIVVLGNPGSLKLFVGCGFEIKDAAYVKMRPCVILEWEA